MAKQLVLGTWLPLLLVACASDVDVGDFVANQLTLRIGSDEHPFGAMTEEPPRHPALANALGPVFEVSRSNTTPVDAELFLRLEETPHASSQSMQLVWLEDDGRARALETTKTSDGWRARVVVEAAHALVFLSHATPALELPRCHLGLDRPSIVERAERCGEPNATRTVGELCDVELSDDAFDDVLRRLPCHPSPSDLTSLLPVGIQ